MQTTPSTGFRLSAAGSFILLLVLLTLLSAGCSADSQTTTTSRGTTPSGVTTTSGAELSTTTTLPIELTDLDRELAKNAKAQNALAVFLENEKAPADDPRRAVIFGLRARSQAISCRQTLDKHDAASLQLADGVMLDIYHMLNLARDLATGQVAGTIASARAIADQIGAPSDHLEEAADLLDQFIEAAAPLLEESDTITGSSTG